MRCGQCFSFTRRIRIRCGEDLTLLNEIHFATPMGHHVLGSFWTLWYVSTIWFISPAFWRSLAASF